MVGFISLYWPNHLAIRFAYFVGAVFMSVLVIVLVLTKKEVCVLDKDESLVRKELYASHTSVLT